MTPGSHRAPGRARAPVIRFITYGDTNKCTRYTSVTTHNSTWLPVREMLLLLLLQQKVFDTNVVDMLCLTGVAFNFVQVKINNKLIFIFLPKYFYNNNLCF